MRESGLVIPSEWSSSPSLHTFSHGELTTSLSSDWWAPPGRQGSCCLWQSPRGSLLFAQWCSQSSPCLPPVAQPSPSGALVGCRLAQGRKHIAKGAVALARGRGWALGRSQVRKVAMDEPDEVSPALRQVGSRARGSVCGAAAEGVWPAWRQGALGVWASACSRGRTGEEGVGRRKGNGGRCHSGAVLGPLPHSASMRRKLLMPALGVLWKPQGARARPSATAGSSGRLRTLSFLLQAGDSGVVFRSRGAGEGSS